MNRRIFLKLFASVGSLLCLPKFAYSKTYLTIEQAKELIWSNMPMCKTSITLTKGQMEQIRKSSRVRVRSKYIKAWRTENGGWFIIDQVIGKHENIDVAIGLEKDGSIKGIEILVYRETYGDEIRNFKWRSLFYGKNYNDHLKLDVNIPNISGATLSCRHMVDGINRITKTWYYVLKSYTTCNNG